MGSKQEIDTGPNETEELLRRTGYSTSRGGHFNVVHFSRRIISSRPVRTSGQAISELLEQVLRANRLNPFSTESPPDPKK